MKALALYIRYAFRSFVRGRSRSLFGAFCVAVGITSVVALGLVGLARVPFHVEDLRPRPHVLLRVSVAVEAPLHV